MKTRRRQLKNTHIKAFIGDEAYSNISADTNLQQAILQNITTLRDGDGGDGDEDDGDDEMTTLLAARVSPFCQTGPVQNCSCFFRL